MSSLLLVRGLPGSGKTTFAELLASSVDPEGFPYNMFAADDFFMVDGEYRFDPSKLGAAHADCLARTRKALEDETVAVVVHNTFTQRWEMQPYLELAEEFGVRVTVTSVFDGGCSDEELAQRNSHGVPTEAIRKMRQRWENDWRSGNPLPPWERR